MQTIKTKFQSLGFTKGHFQLLTVAVGIFAILFFAQSDLNIKTFFARADKETEMISYDDIRNEVYAEAGIGKSQPGVSQSDLDQFALIDRGTIDGAVLGEAIGIGAIPDADQLLLPEITSQLNLSVTSDNSQPAKLQYQNTTLDIENKSNTVGLLADLNSTDKETLQRSVRDWNKVINELSKVPVPSSLEKYHKAKLTYYAVIMNIGKVYAGDKPESELQLLTKAMLSFSQKVETLRVELNETHQLSL